MKVATSIARQFWYDEICIYAGTPVIVEGYIIRESSNSGVRIFCRFLEGKLKGDSIGIDLGLLFEKPDSRVESLVNLIKNGGNESMVEKRLSTILTAEKYGL